MDKLLTITLISSLTFILYNILLYPLFISLLCKLKNDDHMAMDLNLECNFKVSFIIAAYNESRVIKRKIENTLETLYPKDKLEIIIVSDGSDDGTDKIANSFSDKGVICIHDPERAGKSAALNRAANIATGDILVFSDANNDFSNDAIQHLVKHFVDDNIGAVTGAKHIYENADRESSIGDGLYWKYEARIKKAESYLGSITGAEGEIFAVRRSLFKPIPQGYINDDAAITFDIVKSGYRVLYDSDAKSFEDASKDLVDDINVKIRMTIGGFQTLANEWRYLFPPRHWFAFTFLSHKLLRWLTPHFMIVTFISSLLLINSPYVKILLGLQLLFYSIALYGWLTRSSAKPSKIVYIIMYFTVMNTALFIGFIKYLSKNRDVKWKKAER